MKKISLLIFILFSHYACSQSQEAEEILSHIKYDSTQVYPFIRYDKNKLQWKDFSAIQHFFLKLKNSKASKVKIVHIGDSHIQAGIYPGVARYKLQEIFGYGGFGFLFPYKMIKTHPPYDYETYYRCRNYIWTKNLHRDVKVPMGLVGASIKTLDPNTLMTFVFNNNAIIKDHYKDLKIFCDKDSATFDWQVIVNLKDTVNVSNYEPFPLFNYTEVRMPSAPTERISIKTKKNKPYQKYATFYGALLESSNYNGLLYASVGINGAGFRSILRQERMKQDLKEINPDLVVIDLGANDYFLGTMDTNSYKENLKQIVSLIKEAIPKASILISCSQDIFRYRYYSIKETAIGMRIAREVAFANNCAFYNWYEVSGGRGSMQFWYDSRLAKSDMVHLTQKGYELKSTLFANAILYSYYLFLKGIYDYDDSLQAPTPKNWKYDPAKIKKLVAERSRPIIYRVRYGDNLSSIAKKFGVRYRDIMRWNNMRSTRIFAGQRLRIYPRKRNVYYATSRREKPAPTKTTTKTHGKVKYYTIKKGDTLWNVATKFHVKVSDIKKWNNLRSDKIYPGKRLKLLVD